MRHSPIWAAALVAVAIGGTSAQAQTITSGDAIFQFNTGTAPAGAGMGDFTPGGGTDHLYQNWWWYRVTSGITPNTSEVNFPWVNSATSNGIINPGYPNILVNTQTGLEGTFNATLQHTLTAGAPGAATVVQSMTITNTGATTLSISLFHYVDFDVNGNTQNTAVLSGPTDIRMTITDPNSGNYTEFLGVGANAFQATTYATLRNLLTDDQITNLDNTGLPLEGDFTGAFQWDLVIAPNSTQTIYSALSANELAAIAPVPEPAGLGAVGLAALALRRRWRKVR